jgi:hypothetical protein
MVVVFCEKEKIVKRLAKNQSVGWNLELRDQLIKNFGEDNIKVLYKM